MKLKVYFFAAAVLALIVSGCQDFDELEKNPNVAESVPPSLVFTAIQNELLEEPWSLEQRYNQYWACNYGYYGNNEYNWTNTELKFQVLKDVTKMEEEAIKANAKPLNVYSAMGKFFRARFFVWMSMQVGDVPMKESLKGLENIAPSYDTQKEIFVQVLKWLDEANSDLATLEQLAAAQTDPLSTTLSGDIFLNNNISAWRKVVNSYTLRILITLSKKEADADLDIKGKFAAILGDPEKYPVMESNADNLQVAYNGTTSFYPTNPGSKGFDKGRYNMAATYVKGLTDLNDPRAYVTLNPARARLEDGLSFDSFGAYVGASSGESLDDMTFKAGNGEYSFANQARYYGSLVGPEPAMILGYAEQCFNIAEGINRGWAQGDAGTHYINGIRASMAFYGIGDESTLTVTSQDEEILGTVNVILADYLAQSSVAYKDGADGLEQILTQKYLAFFQNSGLEAFYNQRRTGVPEFLVGPGTGFGGNDPRIPKRWLYPSAEETANADNLHTALQRQYAGEDSKDGLMWILQ